MCIRDRNNSGEDLFHFDSDEDVFCVYSQYIDDLMLLFQLDTVEQGDFELMFGDCGHIYFYLTKEDLRCV